MMTSQTLHVGILSAPIIRFEAEGTPGVQEVSIQNGRIQYNGESLISLSIDCKSFKLYDVVIGIQFHWQRKRNLRFSGKLRFIIEGGLITAVNDIRIEDYLLSVISSEMSATSSLELLKAHAVISRSWVAANLGKHGLYDVCADDHCQRYQGVGMAVGETVRQAISQTEGQILTSGGKVCDTRYYKCCGGTTELFSSCWEDIDYSYLPALPDTPSHNPSAEAFCNTSDDSILSQVLNDYDLETKDFFRWEVSYSTEALSELVEKRLSAGLGTITDLKPLRIGPSGRIVELQITGTKGHTVVSKELAIRRALSESHLKSSAFEVEKTPQGFTLRGRGWGHGVGLCQIGAAVMAARGYDYRQILAHYYPGTTLEALSL